MNYLQKKKKAMLNYVSGITPPLPSAYQQVEWIGAYRSGARLEIDTQIQVDDYLETVCATDNTGSDKFIITQYPWNNPTNTRFALCGGYSSNGVWGVAFGNQATDVTNLSGSKDTDFHKHTYQSKTFTIEDLSISSTFSNLTYAQPYNTNGIRIFWGWNAETSGKIKTFIQKRNGEEIVNLIPCYRKADQVIGMYDTVTQTFYTNQGIGTFTKGNDV